MKDSRAVAAVLAAILLCAALLSCFWVFQVPFFQDPDENAHADYAFSLYTAGHLIRARDGVAHTDVHPYTRYLEQVSNYRGMRFNRGGRVPEQYGERSFYALVDAHVPRIDPQMFARVQHPIPYVASAYSFFFYGCEALVLAAASFFSGGSLTTMFFAMRFFCVLLMSIMLFFAFATMRELHVDRVRSLILTAAIGFFPLVSWHAAYVQQDNLACAAISASLYLALRTRRLGLTPLRAMALGLVLGVAGATKLPYVFAISFAVLLCIAGITPRLRDAWKRVLAWVLLLLPIVVILGISFYFERSLGPESILAQKPWTPGVGVSLLEVLRAAWSLFGLGLVSARFWHGFSIGDITLIGTFSVTFILHVFIVFFTVATIVIMLYRQINVYRRLTSVAKRRSLACAFRIFTSDPVLNAYFMVIVLMIFIDALSHALLSSGRYWVVFITPAFLCGIWYAPRVLGRRRAGPLSAALLLSLLAFSVVSIPFSWHALRVRFYDSVPRGLIHREDMVEVDQPMGENIVVPHGMPLRIQGIAIDGTTGTPARGVFIVLDGRYRFHALYGIANNRTVYLIHDDTLQKTGFAVTVDTTHLTLGKHTVEIFMESRMRSQPYPTTKTFSFSVL